MMVFALRAFIDTLGFHTGWTGGDFVEFETASGVLSLFMYSRKEFVKAIGESYIVIRMMIQHITPAPIISQIYGCIISPSF